MLHAYNRYLHMTFSTYFLIYKKLQYMIKKNRRTMHDMFYKVTTLTVITRVREIGQLTRKFKENIMR